MEPNEIEPSLVCIHHSTLSALVDSYFAQFALMNRFITVYFSLIQPQSTVRAIYSYQAAQPDELSFSNGAWIYNVSKENDDW